MQAQRKLQFDEEDSREPLAPGAAGRTGGRMTADGKHARA